MSFLLIPVSICICNSSECWTMSQFSSQHITLLLTLMCVCVCASVTVCVFVRNSASVGQWRLEGICITPGSEAV